MKINKLQSDHRNVTLRLVKLYSDHALNYGHGGYFSYTYNTMNMHDILKFDCGCIKTYIILILGFLHDEFSYHGRTELHNVGKYVDCC